MKGISSRTEKVKNVQIFPFTDKIGLFSQYLRNKKFFFFFSSSFLFVFPLLRLGHIGLCSLRMKSRERLVHDVQYTSVCS